MAYLFAGTVHARERRLLIMVDGVLHYTSALAIVPVNFPKGYEDCQHCTWLRPSNIRCECRLTDEVLVDLKARGFRCPAIFISDQQKFIVNMFSQYLMGNISLDEYREYLATIVDETNEDTD